MKTPCVEPSCVWQLDDGALFCGLCGKPGSTLVVEPEGALQGLVFYPRSDESDLSQRLTLRADGHVALPTTLSVGLNYELVGPDGQTRDRVCLTVPAGGDPGVSIEIRPTADFLEQGDILKLDAGTTSTEIQLRASTEPSWRLRHGTGAVRQGDVLRLYPDDPAIPQWSLAIHPAGGCAVVTSLVVVDGDDSVEVVPPSDLPRLVEPNDALDFGLAWSGPPTGSRLVKLGLELRGGQLVTFELEVHSLQPIDLKGETPDLNSEKPLYFSGRGEQFIDVVLTNAGSGVAHLVEVRADHPGVRLDCVELLGATYPQDQDRRKVMPPGPGGALLGEVIQAVIPDKGTGPATSDETESEQSMRVGFLRFAVSGEVEPRGGVLDFRLTIRARAEDHESRFTLPVTVLAERVVDELEHVLLLDYGTVHTCAAVNPPIEGRAGPLVVLDRSGSGTGPAEHTEQFKSSYRVRKWRQGSDHDLKFGQETWDGLAQYVASTDVAAKLRLGTGRTRPLRDEGIVIKQVSGGMAAGFVLAEVLKRVERETGRSFRKVRLTHPAAFETRATDELRGALVDLGFDADHVEFPASEPEAYLYWLGSTDLKKELEDIYRSGNVDPRSGIIGIVFDVGGGTTDVTIFRFVCSPGPQFHVLGTHGYRWLGGERITELMAAELHATIEARPGGPDDGPSNYPFPQTEDPSVLRSQLLDSRSAAEQYNYGELRKMAEAVKCDPTKRGTDDSLYLLTHGGESKPVRITRSEEVLKGLVQRLVERALADITDRLVHMGRFGVADDAHPYPHVVAVAGNSGQLWCLKELVLAWLKREAGSEPKYHFEPLHAKTGVLEGLANYMEDAVVLIRDLPYLARWWFVRAQGVYRLGLPAGVRLDELLEADRVPSSVSMYVTGALQLASGPGPGPENGVDLHDMGREHLRERGGVLPPPELEPGQYCEIRMGVKDRQIGLWFRTLGNTPEEAGSWLWSPLDGVEPEVTGSGRR